MANLNKICPFNENKSCNETCPLYISSDELNEYVVSKLSAIGVMKREVGECSLKMLALSQSRIVFENTNTR